MPQTLTEEWRAMLGEEAQRVYDTWLHTVGNLTLTGYNEDLSNLPFARKRERLLESHLELNGYFAAVERWTEAEIQARAEVLAERALQIWPRGSKSAVL